MQPRDYLQLLRDNRILRPKMMKCLEYVIINVNDCNVTSVLLKAYDLVTRRQLNQSGLTNWLSMVQKSLPNERIFHKIGNVDISNGRYQLRYSTQTTLFEIIEL